MVILERTYTYKLISIGFLYPDEIWNKKILEILEKFKNYNNNLKKEIFMLWNSFDISSSKLLELQIEHSKLFGSNPLVPFDLTYYTGDNEFMRAKEMADISGFYKAFGLELTENQRVDNISICFEFLSFLLLKEIHASSNNNDKIDIVKNAFKSFLNDHIVKFTEKFVKKLNDNSDCLFYDNLSSLLDKFINQEKQITT